MVIAALKLSWLAQLKLELPLLSFMIGIVSAISGVPLLAIPMAILVIGIEH